MKTSLRKLVLGFMIAVLFVTTFAVAVPTQSAAAGSNGQQLELKSNPSTTFQVTGTNQWGKKVTFSFRTAMSGTVKTDGYWWVGTVSVTVYGLGGLYKTCTQNVPKQSSSNYYTITCR